MDQSHTPTYGEQLVRRLLMQLPEDEFYCYAEPRIDSATVTSRYPDFVIVWRERGMICVEVKDWKQIVGGDQREIKVQTNQGLKHHSNPYRTAKDYVHRVMKKIETRRELMTRYNGDEVLAFPVEPLAVLTHQDYTTLSWLIHEGLFPDTGVLGSDDLVSIHDFRKALSRVKWTFALPNRLSQTQVEVIQHTLNILEVRARKEADDSPGIKRGSLIPEQDEIIWSPMPVKENGISTTLVRGVVGSGKTIVLSKRADLLAELRPDLKIIVTAFNKDLASDLKMRIKNPRVRVMQIFDLIGEILDDDYPQATEYRGQWDPKSNKRWCKSNQDLFGLPMDFVSQEISRRKDLDLNTEAQYLNDLRKRDADLLSEEIDELSAAFDLYTDFQEHEQALGHVWQDYDDTVRMALSAIHGHKYHRYFDIVMVDEGQDFSPGMFDLTRSMIKPGGYLFVCDDPIQSLWRQFDLRDKGLQNAQIKLLKLPMRTTREISEAAQSLFEMIPEIRTDDDNEIYPAQTEHLALGGQPHLIEYNCREHEQKAITQCIEQRLQEQAPDSIAVITPQFSKYWQEKLSGMGVYYGQFNVIKGLEFETVYISQLDDLFQSQWNERRIMKRWLYRKFFVAMTRARRNLYMSHIGSLPRQIMPLNHYCETYRVEKTQNTFSGQNTQPD